jgi:hypothetical protein
MKFFKLSLLSRPLKAVQVSTGMLALGCFASLSCAPNGSAAAPATAVHIDFGNATTQPGYVVADEKTPFSVQLGHGWLELGNTDLSMRDRGKPDDLNRDFIWGKSARTFRVAGLTPGRYLLKIVAGDTDYGDHVLRVRVPGAGEWPLVAPKANEFLTLSATVNMQGTLDITFDSPQNNWVVNSLSLEPTEADLKPSVATESVKNTWDGQVFATDPTKPLLEQFRQDLKGKAPANFRPTALDRREYLKLIASEVDFWKQHQNENGAIIDPYSKEEIQYSTPAFANAAAVLVARDKRADLIEPAAKAMDWATRSLAERRAASGHEDFYPTMIAHAYALLKPLANPERVARWEGDIRRFDPYKTYRMEMGSMNWNIVALSGEAMFQKLGLRDKNNRYVQDSLAAQGHHFGSPFGLYLEGPMAYDHFPRIFLADVIAQGYDGPYSNEVAEALRRAAITSLFMQSPWGEMPAGHRSAHHQWNEAEQCVTYEIYAAQALSDGDEQLAGVYKRAAHLALASMQRWVRPSGEMQVVKNWVDPSKRHAYESYSAHSNYNLLPMSMLATAYEYAATTETVPERPAPADVGGYVLEISDLHKVFANAGGTYVEIDTKADHHYDATGLIRVHAKGLSPQLGPSDSLMAAPAYNSPAKSPFTTGVGVSWKDANGAWSTLGETDPQKWTATTIASSPERVAFDVAYEGDLFGVPRIVEHYVVTPGRVELTTEVPGYNGPLRYVWPVLADDGRTQSTIEVKDGTVTVSQDRGKTAQTFAARGAQSVEVEDGRYSNHNGWAQLAVAEYSQGGKITLAIAPKFGLTQ